MIGTDIGSLELDGRVGEEGVGSVLSEGVGMNFYAMVFEKIKKWFVNKFSTIVTLKKLNVGFTLINHIARKILKMEKT